MSQAEALYYSEAAVDRFREHEQMVRRRQLNVIPFDFSGRTALAADTFMGLSAAEKMIMSPLFGAWLDRIIQAAHSPSTERDGEQLITNRINYIGNYAVAAALAGGEDIEVYARSANNRIIIPEYGRATLHGPDDKLVRAEVYNGDITLTSPSSEAKTRISQDMLDVPAANWEPLRNIGTDDFTVVLNDIDPNRRIFKYPPASRLTEEQYHQWKTAFRDAWSFLQDYDPHLAGILRASLTTIVPAPSEPLTHGKSMAAAAAFGVIGINENRDPIRLASHLAFGTRKHMIMALRNESPNIYLPEDDPIASKPIYPPSREGYGIAPYLQDDSFLNVGLAHFFSGLAHNPDPTLRAYGELSFSRWYTEAQQNLDALHDSGYIRAANRDVITALQEEMATLTARFETMPEHVKQIVATNAHDRRLSWRLHTIIPDQQAIMYLRDRWHSGGGCPSITIPGSLSKDAATYTNIGQRNRYVLTEVRIKEPALFKTVTTGTYNPELFGQPTLGDIAFAQGDIRGARAYFRDAIQRQPDNAEAWAGFALTFEKEQSTTASVLATQPEVAAAVYGAIADTSIEPETVAAWLAPSRMADVLQDA